MATSAARHSLSILFLPNREGASEAEDNRRGNMEREQSQELGRSAAEPTPTFGRPTSLGPPYELNNLVLPSMDVSGKSKARRGGRALASSFAWRRASRRSARQTNLFQSRKCFRHSRETVSCPFLTCAIAAIPCSCARLAAAAPSAVMRGLDPRIHDERPHKRTCGQNCG